MSLLRFWPAEQNVLDCIKPEAENPLDAVFLAVHQPMKLKRRQFGNDRAKDGTEHDLLDDFLRRDLPTGTLLMPILGNSGIGKSHLVRWLDVQLRQRSDSDKRHVIRIPKSSSLKSVLKRILDGLEGSQYDEIRQQLQSAREQMTSIQATERVRAELITAIRQRTELAKERRARARETGGAVDTTEDLWIGHGDQRYLPALLSDPITSCIFMEDHDGQSGTIARLARHLTEDRAADSTPVLEFSETDFDIPVSLENKIKDAALPARQYLRKLNQTNGHARRQATELLNEIIDDAIAPLATPADTSLSELFYSVRRQLLDEGRELILLVEDFAVLTGIQGALLDAMIREGVRGEQEACVMRTALAVTEGYFKSYETVRTRAVYAWYIDEIPDESEDHTISRICDFSGAYLNAARFGADELKKHCKPDAHDHSWVPDFADSGTLTPEESEQLNAFGHSVKGRALFPLNRNAIAEIAHWRMRDQDDRLRFNPREIINDLLIPVLREYRQLHQRGDFPPDWFMSYDPTDMEEEVRSQIAERFRNPPEQKRLCVLVRFWGGNPDDLSNLQLPKPIYDAFGLPALDGSPTSMDPPPEVPAEPVTQLPPPQENERGPETEPETKAPEAEPPEITEWFKRLRVWSQGQNMIQRDANQLRSMIADAVTATIDWDAELLRPLRSAETSFLKEWVFLPSARGASQCDPSNAFVVVATQEQFDDPDQQLRVIQALRAIVRFRHYKTWDFERADDDFPRYANLLEELRQQAIVWIKDSYRKVDGDPVPALGESLLIGARMLDINSAHAREDVALIEALFTSGERPPEGQSAWEQLRTECFECRAEMTEELLARAGVRQGTGTNIYAVDAVRLLDSIKTIKSTWKPTYSFPKHRSGEEAISHLEKHVRGIGRQLEAAVKGRRDEILSQGQLIQSELGADFDKQVIVTEVNKVIETTKHFGVKDSQDNLSQLATLVEDFRDAAVTKCLQHIARIGDETEGGALLSALAQIDDDTLALVSRFVSDVTEFLGRTEAKVGAELSVLGTNIVANAKEEVDSRFRSIEQVMPSAQEGLPNDPT